VSRESYGSVEDTVNGAPSSISYGAAALRGQSHLRPVRQVAQGIDLRHPNWGGDGSAVTINGRKTAGSAPGTYLERKRTWPNEAVIVARCQFSSRLSPCPMTRVDCDPTWPEFQFNRSSHK
jgi:hypothetical protein